MTKSQLPVRVGNEIHIDQYVTEIKTELCNSTSASKLIAEIFAAAQEQFGCNSRAMSKLGIKTDSSKSKLMSLYKLSKANV